MAVSQAELEAALEPISSALEADGYAVAATQEPGEVRIVVTAGPDACEECLVPKDLMEAIVRDCLGPVVAGSAITLAYPTD